MPAIITHHLFGEDAAKRLPEELAFSDEELLAFLLGNQGPDPFYFCFTATPATIRTCHTLADAMHAQGELDTLAAAVKAVGYLPLADRGIGRAFVLGFGAHYLLDSEAHAFIAVQEDAICNAGVGLDDAHAQVHALIESELDTWMLWSTRHLTIEEAPAHANLARTKRISRVIGTIFSQLAWEVYDTPLAPDSYEGCLRDYELVYRAIDPLGNPRGKMVMGAERLGARYPILEALAHEAKPCDDCPAANLACHPWLDPLSGEEQTTSFPDIFYDALDRWPLLAEALLSGDRTQLEALVSRGYDGKPLAVAAKAEA